MAARARSKEKSAVRSPFEPRREGLDGPRGGVPGLVAVVFTIGPPSVVTSTPGDVAQPTSPIGLTRRVVHRDGDQRALVVGEDAARRRALSR